MTTDDTKTREVGPTALTGDYVAASIVVFSGLEAVRRNPSMYVGSTDADGLHHLVFELVDNAVDEHEAGHCRDVHVTVHDDGSCSVRDDGRGIPTGPHPETGRPACEVVLTTLHSGGKFGGDSYATSAGLHGVGLCCVNALSRWLSLDVWRDGEHVRQDFARGEPAGDPVRVDGSTRRGTLIRFGPDDAVFGEHGFDAATIADRMEEVAFLHPGLSVRFTDERTGREDTFLHLDGVRGLLEHRNRHATVVHPAPIVVADRSGSPAVEIALWWTEGYVEEIWSFVNGVRTKQGGSHVEGLRAGLASAVNRYAADHGMLDTFAGERITTVDILEGLTAAMIVRMDAPRFDGQVKQRLRTPEVAHVLKGVVERALWQALLDDPDLGRRVVARALDATRARLAARLAGRTARHRPRELEIDYTVYQRQFGIRSRNWHDSCSWLTDDGLLARHAALCEVPADTRMLDVCCGSGVVGNAFAGRVGEMIGLDITPEMVRLASDRLDRVDQGTVYDMPYEDGAFGLVVNREVLHLLPQPEKPLAEIFRVLRPGGQFIVGQIVPYADEDAFWMFRIFKKKQPLLFQMFREQDFRSLLLDAGFVDPRMEEYFLWESIDLWIDTHETTPAHRSEIRRLYYDAPAEVRAVHPFEVRSDGSVRDRWRWCVYSLRKPLG
ncbi:methyltransferase domain-containing protein [Umezawaea sp. Da 62-37]|uniref:methyltransferase domain-containing protein n=1 Tax=Umezawaea sp. Da 62-37 TaxID=3075927 RepID=UPI0028F70839|nr:methyltransferase domain-containing protein [Umezawaea sp. Da 62-37]WNV84998.1 ATP-binding protein [Umezawaea sp. Da 62-37]